MKIIKDMATELFVEKSIEVLKKIETKTDNKEPKKRNHKNSVRLPFELTVKPHKTVSGYTYIFSDEKNDSKYIAKKILAKRVWEIYNTNNQLIGSVRKVKTYLKEYYELKDGENKIGKIICYLPGCYKLSSEAIKVDIHKDIRGNSYNVKSNRETIIQIIRNNYPNDINIAGKMVKYNKQMKCAVKFLSEKEEITAILIAMTLEYDRVETIKIVNRPSIDY